MAFRHEVEHGWMLSHQFKVVGPSLNEDLAPAPKIGTTVKVVMVSRFGDCGITSDLTKEHGYSCRVAPSSLAQIPDYEYLELPCECLRCEKTRKTRRKYD